MGCIYKRGHTWWIKYSSAGRSCYESSGSGRKSDAQTLLKMREGDIAKGVPVTSQVGRLRFEEAAKDLRVEYEYNGRRSLSDLTRRLKLHLAPFFAKRRMATIRPADVRRYTHERLHAGAAPAQVNRELAVLKRMFSLAVKDEKLLYQPHIPMLAENNVRTGFFEAEEFRAVCAHLQPSIRAVVTFAYLTGWRVRSEVLPMEWRQVDFAAGTVRLDPGTTKNRRGREFPFSEDPDLLDLLTHQREVTRRIEQQAGQIVPYVFHRNGRPIRTFYGAWRRACAAAGCPGRIPHDLRRSAVRNLVRAGVSEQVAMKLTGHKTREVFDRYDITSDNDVREAVRKRFRTANAATIGKASGRVHRMR